MDSERVLAVQHRQEVGPGGVLCLFGVIKEDVDTLMVLLKHRQFYMIEKDTIQPIKLLKKSVLIWQFATMNTTNTQSYWNLFWRNWSDKIWVWQTSYCAPTTFIICLFTSESMVYLSTVRISLSLPAECHRSESGCIGPSAPWRCEPSGWGRSLRTGGKKTNWGKYKLRHDTHKSLDNWKNSLLRKGESFFFLWN